MNPAKDTKAANQGEGDMSIRRFGRTWHRSQIGEWFCAEMRPKGRPYQLTTGSWG
jgi:hypothetical protein